MAVEYDLDFHHLQLLGSALYCMYTVTHYVYLCHFSQPKDLLQLMIDACDSETADGMETGDIVAESVGIMLGGSETTSSTLAFATYLLATHPEVQERLANEIHEYLDENPVSVHVIK